MNKKLLTKMRSYIFTALGVGIVATSLLYQFLNFSGYCYEKKAWLSNAELVDIAVSYEIRRVNRLYKFSIKTANDFYGHFQKSSCCSVTRWPSSGWGINDVDLFVQRIFSRYLVAVIVSHPKYVSDYLLNSCGKTVESYGWPR